jgi:RNA polymerase sigma-70 factor (sigma-E family)
VESSVKQSVEHEFTAYVAARTPTLMRVAYTMTGDHRAAEDLVQGALAKAFVHWGRIRGDPEPYVRRIIYNDQMSVWRRLGRRREVPLDSAPDRASTDRHDQDTTLRLLLRDALQSLPPRQRAVLVLRYLEELSVDETAAALGCRPGTVASQASRALTRLRELVPDLNELTEGTEVLR